jgi:hypothetical protein
MAYRTAGVVPSKHLVTAREGSGAMPAHFRPQNQALLYRSASANPSAADDRDQLAGMGVVLSGNGMGDNGLTSPGQTRRLARKVDHLHSAQRGKLEGFLGQLGAAGSPNANPLPTGISMSFNEAMRALPAGSPMSSQSTIIDRIRRDLTDSWEISQAWSGATQVFVAQLVRTTPTGQHMILLTSDDLSTEQDARSYIQAHEFARQAVQGKPPRLQFNSDLTKAQGLLGLGNLGSSAAVRRSLMVPTVPGPSAAWPGRYQPGGNVTNLTNREVQRLEMDGLGAMPSTTTFLGLAALAGAAYLYFKRK